MPNTTSRDEAENPPSQSDDGSATLPDCGDSIDPATFEQILEMDDDDEERDFSRGIVYGFFEQADATFTKMEQSLQRGDLGQLSSLGHFLKGSSATLGLTKVKDSCEKIQNIGERKDESGNRNEPDDVKSLNRVKEILGTVMAEYAEAEKRLKQFYHDTSI